MNDEQVRICFFLEGKAGIFVWIRRRHLFRIANLFWFRLEPDAIMPFFFFGVDEFVRDLENSGLVDYLLPVVKMLL